MKGDKLLLIPVVGMIGIFIAIIYFAFTILPIAFAIIDIETNLEPILPYDYATLDEVLDSSTSKWEIVIRVVDVETNQTMYDQMFYNIETKEFSNYSLVNPVNR